MNIICCGSKLYKNINLDDLVDSFDTIFRHNLLLPNCGYGKKLPSLQVLNNHVFDNYKLKIPFEKWQEEYREYKITKEHLKQFYDFLQNENIVFTHFTNNNTEIMSEVLKRHDIVIKNYKLLRCGLSSVASLTYDYLKPFLIGYSLEENQNLLHTYNAKNLINKNFHDGQAEIDIIIELHNKGLLDATFCCIEDCKKLTLNNKIPHTKTALKILESIYG